MTNNEIIKKIGQHTLVARRPTHAEHCVGVIWRDGEKVFHAERNTLDDVFALLESQHAELVVSQLQTNTTTSPTAELARKAFAALAPDLPVNRLRMLRAHFHAPEQCITARQLAEAAGYANYGSANLQYGLLAADFWALLPTAIKQRKDGTRIWTFALAEAGNVETAKEEEWVWGSDLMWRRVAVVWVALNALWLSHTHQDLNWKKRDVFHHVARPRQRSARTKHAFTFRFFEKRLAMNWASAAFVTR